MVSHWRWNDSKSPQISRILLNILTDHNNTVVWIVSTCPLISKSSSPFTNSFRIVSSVLITIGIMFHSFISYLARSRYLSPLSLSFIFTLVCQDSKVHYYAGFVFCRLSLALVVCPRLGDLIISQSPRKLSESHSQGCILGCAYTTCSYGQISISCTIHIGSPCPPSCVQSYIFCANFLNSLIMRLFVSSLLPHNQHLLFCFTFSVLALT